MLTIPVAEGVTVELNPDTNEYFTLEGNVLKAAVVFDYEVPQMTLDATDGIFVHVWLKILDVVK